MSAHDYHEVLHHLKLESVYYSRSVMGGRDWGVDVPAESGVSMFHVVVAGRCIVEINGHSFELCAGDLLFISRACGHVVKGRHDAEARCLLDLPVKKVSDFYETLTMYPEVDDKTIVLCGVVKLLHPVGEMLLRDMPDLIHMKEDEHLFGQMMGDVVRLMFREASGEFIGGETVITRLADILLIQTIRHWVEHAGSSKGQWLNALQDEQIGRALASIHAEPEKPWTIESLGRVAGMSRTAFSNRFCALLGEPVFRYLTKWRMNLAVMRIRSGESVDMDFVESLGYTSESAFRRAFKKTVGSNVSEIRRQGSAVF
ncbi:MAG TPA: AraC family transcriptional regulator [Myxococcales bacterium]|nr:AraC family transcriptional regulator [Deltaproteobacteria bacterium]MBU51968.1 AraC family transcriptional regulator [Deltaproteobacteria bacterium]HAA57070.1 AraC family transcriptional regulator [Myxococcales bacterium]|tara:strand:- start:856 stop:1797 length:942 start_codon:yes stop_codon:yes gene_type:complete